MRLKDKAAIITGGASGIGWEAVQLFAQEGAKVAIADFNREAAEEKAASLGDNVMAVHVNVADRESVEGMIEQVAGRFGGIDILVNNAGITKDAMLKKLAIEDFHRVIDVNLTGVFHCTQAALPYIEKSTAGRIINTTSVSGVYGNVGQTNYSAAKAGVVGMTKTWAKELGRKGITVNAVAPGFIATSMVETMPEMIIEQVKLLIPSQKLGKPQDIANAYLYLASDEAGYVNGTVLEVDGGMLV